MRLVVGIAFALLVAGCSEKSPHGFRLPDGNAEYGRLAFSELGCGGCHQLNGEPSTVEENRRPVTLGGDVTRVQTYGMLVTSIINPSHRIAPRAPIGALGPRGESVMASAALNDTMTVSQLVDLVAFLQPLYNVVPTRGDPYVYVYLY